MALSMRGHISAQPNTGLLMWDVLGDLWDPLSKPNGFVNLGMAENTLMHSVVSKHIRDNLKLPLSAFTYGEGPTGSTRLKMAMARFLNQHFKPNLSIEPAHIVVTNGCSSALEHTAWAFGNPGEGFLLGQPYYGTFIADLSLRSGTSVIPVPFDGLDPFCLNAVQAYEEALLRSRISGVRIAGLVLCNPHNPLGRCYPRETLMALMRFCEKYEIHLISDEIYALSVFSNTTEDIHSPVPFESCLSIDPSGLINPSRLHVLWGMSKDFGANGVRVGTIISQRNPELHKALLPVSLYSSCSSISDHATANILEDDKWIETYILENQRKLAEHHAIAVSWARDHGVPYGPGVNAAFFLWVDLGSFYRTQNLYTDSSDITQEIMKALLRERVFLASGTQFGSEQPGWFRIVFSIQRDLLEEGLKRIISALTKTDKIKPDPMQ